MIKSKPFKSKSYTADESGNVSLMFAGLLVMVLTVVGVAIETSTLHNSKTRLQDQLDAAILAVAVSELESREEQILFARNFIDSNGYEIDLKSLDISQAGDSELVISGSIEPKTAFSDFLNYDPKISGLSAVSIGASPEQPIDLVLVLDTTESMSGSKLASLKTAAGNLIDTLPSDDEIKVGIVPFSNYVNVGVHNRNEPWINVPPDGSESYEFTRRRVVQEAYCRSTGETVEIKDGVAYTASGRVCSDYVPEVVEELGTETGTRDIVWSGCVFSRNHSRIELHLEDDYYDEYKINGQSGVTCGQPIVPLTDQMSVVKTAINSLETDKDTYMPAGIMWGRRVLSEKVPFAGGRSSDEVKKIMIMMTDGQNSMHRWGQSHGTSDIHDPVDVDLLNQTNEDTKTLCSLAKSEGTEVYSIAFEVNDYDTKRMLEGCASEPLKYFDARSSSQLLQAFDDIADQLKSSVDLRLTR